MHPYSFFIFIWVRTLCRLLLPISFSESLLHIFLILRWRKYKFSHILSADRHYNFAHTYTQMCIDISTSLYRVTKAWNIMNKNIKIYFRYPIFFHYISSVVYVRIILLLFICALGRHIYIFSTPKLCIFPLVLIPVLFVWWSV